MDACSRLERAARALLGKIDASYGDDGSLVSVSMFDSPDACDAVLALRAALDAAPKPAPVAGVWVRPERDFVKWAEKCVNGPETLRTIQGVYGQGLVDAQNAAPAPAQVVEVVARAVRETALVNFNTPQEYDVACAQRAACEMAALNYIDAHSPGGA